MWSQHISYSLALELTISHELYHIEDSEADINPLVKEEQELLGSDKLLMEI